MVLTKLSQRISRPRNFRRCVDAVTRLFFSRGPLAVLFAVIAVIVYAVQRLAFWALSHVFQKILKFIPSLTERYAASTVPVVMGCFGVGASLLHRKPRPVGIAPIGGFARSVAMFCNGVYMRASTTSGVVGNY